jgi:thioredoxin 1
MSNLLEITAENFQEEVLDSNVPVLLEFGAVWCGPCKMLEPVLKEMAAEWNGRVKVASVDVDHHQSIAIDYQVMSVPTMMLFKDGQMLERLTGYMPKKRIYSKLDPHL